MRNKLDNVIKIKIEGKNINNYIKRLIKDNINILEYIPISHKEANIIIKYNDYLKILEYKTIYKVTIISKHGRLKLIDIIKNNIYMFISIIIGIIFLYTISNIIFDIKVIHSSSDIKKLVYRELKNNGIDRYIFKKSYNELEIIEDKILEDNKDKLEWIEIVEVGTKYIVRVEERIMKENIDNDINYDIVASKNAIIYSINAYIGEKVKKINDYVSKDDIVISGSILKPDGSKIITSSRGSVYGEVWYTIDVEYPFIYREETPTGNSREVYVINFLNKKISLFNFNKYKTYNTKTKNIISNNFLPISLIKEKQYEVNVIDDYYTKEEAIDKAIELSKDKLLTNNKIIKIKDITILENISNESIIKLKLFISVIEDIGIYKEISIE